MIKAILFDFWGTLVENGIYPSPVKQVKYILRLNMPFRDYVVRFEEAMMTKPHADLNEAFDAVCKEFGISANEYVREKLVGMWNKNELLGKPFMESIEVLEYLKAKKIKVGLVANTTPTIKRVIEKYDLAKHFDVEAFSYEKGLLKTNPEMFQGMLAELKLKPEEVIMIGDSIQTDIIGARNAGIRSILIDRMNKRDFKPKIINMRELMALIESDELDVFASQEMSREPIQND